ncbi:FKBP-type peptidyl-prolyl cis-trans isomerase [Acidicapsa ligni]|uniref:FKBP-type peptidyl-prolyl cis-trans isomerase n=1 Tax=Acidicapsa ligni TaxID=542300 RepID=UPI0021E0FBF3|nr:FKBP-type peptidyl-prolyl cis-trans isomerase [Acidicapsa ligni]
MKRTFVLFALTAALAAAQTPTTPAPKSTAKPATAGTVHKSATGSSAVKSSTAGTRTAGGIKLPPGIQPVHGLVRSAFALRYQEIKIGTGALAEPNKLYKVAYTGWLAADGKKFDSSLDHPGAAPIQFPQGRGRVIPGWDQGFEGMKIGGKRRLFIPYQLAYGTIGRPPVIPAKSDLIFDVELVAVDDMPTQPMMPGGHPMPRRPGMQPGAPQTAPSPSTPPTTGAPAKPADPAQPSSTAPAPAPATPPVSAPASTPAPADKPANPAQPN